MVCDFLEPQVQELAAALKVDLRARGLAEQLREGRGGRLVPLLRSPADELPLAVAAGQHPAAEDVVVPAPPPAAHAAEHDRRDRRLQLRRAPFVQLAEGFEPRHPRDQLEQALGLCKSGVTCILKKK